MNHNFLPYMLGLDFQTGHTYAVYGPYNVKHKPSKERWKLCRKLGRSFPVGLGTSSRILRGSPMVFVLSRNFAVTYALFGYFWVNLPDFQHFGNFWVNCGHFWANFKHFLTAFIRRFSVNGSDSQ